MKQKIKKFFNKILNLMFPNNIKCMFCAEELNQNSYNCTCENCLENVPFITKACSRCGAQINENQQGVCLECKKRNYNFTLAKSIFLYINQPKSVVHGVKYGGKKYLIEHMVKYLTDAFATWNVFPDIITNVPMFPAKEKERGYNQSSIMANLFAKKVNIPFYELCNKVKDTPSQTSLNPAERIKNVENTFAFDKTYKDLIKGKTILIIDDVITTGATTSEISKVLIENGAKDCFVLTFAHTPVNEIAVETKCN